MYVIGAIMGIVYTIILSILGGIAYRIGGSKDGKRWIREAGQGLFAVLEFIALGLVQITLTSIVGVFLSFGVCWAESTYFKKKGTDAKWWNWLLVGMVFGLIPLPYCALTSSHWIGFGIRLPACMVLNTWWMMRGSFIVSNWVRKVWGKDVVDEFGRGFINIVTLPLLLIGA